MSVETRHCINLSYTELSNKTLESIVVTEDTNATNHGVLHSPTIFCLKKSGAYIAFQLLRTIMLIPVGLGVVLGGAATVLDS